MKCPECGLENPSSAMRCDCGYDFKSRRMMASYLEKNDPLRGAVGSSTAKNSRNGLKGFIERTNTAVWLLLFVAVVHEFMEALHSQSYLSFAWMVAASVLGGIVQRKLSGGRGKEVSGSRPNGR